MGGRGWCRAFSDWFLCTYGLTTKPDYVSNHSHVVMLDRVTNWTKHTSILSDALDAQTSMLLFTAPITGVTNGPAGPHVFISLPRCGGADR